MGEWIKCSEKMPPKLKTVLVWHLNDWEFGMTFGGNVISIYAGEWNAVNVNTKQEEVYWQPLPEPPQ